MRNSGATHTSAAAQPIRISRIANELGTSREMKYGATNATGAITARQGRLTSGVNASQNGLLTSTPNCIASA